MSCLNVPYVWGGNHPLEGLDCSGYVLFCLKSIGEYPGRDMAAQKIFEYFHKKNYRSQLTRGSLLFFGADRYHIDHVEIAISDRYMIGASGGDSSTRTVEEAIKRGAMVQIKPIASRGGLQGVIKLEEKGKDSIENYFASFK